MGTKLEQQQVTRVVDGDTLKVLINGKEETLRLTCIDTEESLPGGSKPVTEAGKAASAMAKQYFSLGNGFTKIDIEFDTDDSIEVCLFKHRDNYGRLLCYVHKNGENFNLKLIKEGFSPYFSKYGNSRIYHQQMMAAEAEAQANNLVIWNPSTNSSGNSREYSTLLPWWIMRAAIVDDYRQVENAGKVLSIRLDYQKILAASETNENITVFCDLQAGISRTLGEGAVINAGSKFHKFDLWIPDALTEERAPLLRLIEKRYAQQGRGYVYVSGNVKKYKGVPEIVLTDITQLSDFPPA